MISTEHGDLLSKTRITHTVYWTKYEPTAQDIEDGSEIVKGIDISSLFKAVYKRDFIYELFSHLMHLTGVGSESGNMAHPLNEDILKDILHTGYIDSQRRIRILFDDLYTKGIIPAGDYLMYLEYNGEEG